MKKVKNQRLVWRYYAEDALALRVSKAYVSFEDASLAMVRDLVFPEFHKQVLKMLRDNPNDTQKVCRELEDRWDYFSGVIPSFKLGIQQGFMTPAADLASDLMLAPDLGYISEHLRLALINRLAD